MGHSKALSYIVLEKNLPTTYLFLQHELYYTSCIIGIASNVFGTQNTTWIGCNRYLLSIDKNINGVQITNFFGPKHIECDECFDCRACKNIKCVGDHELDSSLHISFQQLTLHTLSSWHLPHSTWYHRK